MKLLWVNEHTWGRSVKSSSTSRWRLFISFEINVRTKSNCEREIYLFRAKFCRLLDKHAVSFFLLSHRPPIMTVNAAQFSVFDKLGEINIRCLNAWIGCCIIECLTNLYCISIYMLTEMPFVDVPNALPEKYRIFPVSFNG